MYYYQKGGDLEIEHMLRLAEASGVEEMNPDQQATQIENRTINCRRGRPPKPSKKLQEYFKSHT